MPPKPPVSAATAELGRRIREARKQLGLSIEAASHRGTPTVHWTYLASVERGQVNPTLHSLLTIAHMVDADPADLVRGLPLPE